MCPRPGYITSSGIKLMMTGGRSKKVKFGKTAHTYAKEIALGRIGVDIPDTAYGVAIDWGNYHESQAIEAYERHQMVEVHSSRVFQYHPDYDWVGGTPDGLIGEEGGVEIKCPYNITNHMMNLIKNEQLSEYKYQIHGFLWITGRSWWSFASYDPRYDHALRLHVHRVIRDDEMIAEIENRYQEFEAIIQAYVEQLNRCISKKELKKSA